MRLFLIPLVPFVGFLFNATLGRRASKSVSGSVAVAAMGASFGIALLSVWAMLGSTPVGGVRALDYTLYTWFAAGKLSVPVQFHLDPLASLMILVITGIGSLIHL